MEEGCIDWNGIAMEGSAGSIVVRVLFVVSCVAITSLLMMLVRGRAALGPWKKIR